MAGPVARAVDKVERTPIRMKQVNVKIGSTGRPTSLILPDDVTEPEVVELAGWMLTQLIPSISQARAAKAPKLTLAHVMPKVARG